MPAFSKRVFLGTLFFEEFCADMEGVELPYISSFNALQDHAYNTSFIDKNVAVFCHLAVFTYALSFSLDMVGTALSILSFSSVLTEICDQ